MRERAPPSTTEAFAAPDLGALREALGPRYVVGEKIGAGGMAVVYAAQDVKLGRQVALKVLRPEISAAVGRERFLREIAVTSRLSHPNIVPLYDAGDSDGLLYYAMPLLAAPTLRAKLQRDPQLPESEALDITRQVGSALQYAHAQGIVHRDIKPENILIENGRVLVADFGVARALENSEGTLTATGYAIGTPAYMSPEQSTGEREVDARTDLYSLAVVLYEMLAGEPPFTGGTAQMIIAKRLSTPAPPIRVLRDGVSESVADALSRALARSPADRYQGVDEFLQALQGRSSRRGFRLPWKAAAVGVGLVAVAVALLFPLRGHPPMAAPSHAPPDSIAHDLVLRGRSQTNRRSEQAVQRGIQLLQQAIARDSNYADAWASLARALQFAHLWRYRIPGIPSDSLVPEMVRASERAIETDSTSAEAWIARAAVLREVDPTSRTGMLEALSRALKLDSSSVEAWTVLGIALADTLRLREGNTALRRAVAIDPSYRNALAFLGLNYLWQHKFDSALVWADSAVRVDPAHILTRQVAGLAHSQMGQTTKAESDFRAVLKLTTGADRVSALTGLAELAWKRGEKSAAELLVREAIAHADTVHPSIHDAVYLGSGFVAIRKLDRALGILGRYQPRGDLHYQLHLRMDPAFEPLRGDPRYQALLTAGLTPR